MQVQYSIEWQVAERWQQASAAKMAALQLRVRLQQRHQQKLATAATAPCAAVTAAAQMLQHLQLRQATTEHQQQLCLLAPISQAACFSNGSGRRMVPSAAAAAAGILRVASSEAPEEVLSSVYADTLAARQSPQDRTASAARADACGVQLSAGTMLLPRLLPAASSSNETSSGGGIGLLLHPQPASWRRAAITGGLGGLGLLAAAWLAWQGAQQVLLLGRSGR